MAESLRQKKRFTLQAWWPRFCKDVEEHTRKCPKYTEIKTFKQTKIHTWHKEGVGMEKDPYEPCNYPRH